MCPFPFYNWTKHSMTHFAQVIKLDLIKSNPALTEEIVILSFS